MYQLITPDNTVLDIDASIGHFTILALKLLVPKAAFLLLNPREKIFTSSTKMPGGLDMAVHLLGD